MTLSFFSACEHLGVQHPLGAEVWFFPNNALWVGKNERL